MLILQRLQHAGRVAARELQRHELHAQVPALAVEAALLAAQAPRLPQELRKARPQALDGRLGRRRRGCLRNLSGLVLGCIEPKFCNGILSDTILSYLIRFLIRYLRKFLNLKTFVKC